MSLETLRENRAVILGCEAIGWVHMLGKAHPDFLRDHGGQRNSRDFKRWFASLTPDWDSRMSWLKPDRESPFVWPQSLTAFLTDFAEGQSKASVVGLLQAAHAMASGVEKNHPSTTKYLGQDVTHMWRASPFGHAERNLLVDPPPILQSGGYDALLADVCRVLDELGGIANPFIKDAEPWAQWRSGAIGPESLIRRSFLETLAETRIPNNDVTLWDQSYVAAALFKAAVAGAVLAANNNDWKDLRTNTQWRVLVVGIGAEHYENRAIRVGDWTGARRETDAFFDDVCRLIEVDAPVGSVLYRDGEVMAFSFPGLKAGGLSGSLDDGEATRLKGELETAIDDLARQRNFETPPLVTLSSASTRSFISMAKELEEARRVLKVPLPRAWGGQEIDGQCETSKTARGHTCPVCLVRPSAKTDEKQAPCEVCRDRRRGRLAAWLNDEIDQDTIWISEIADRNDRLALLSFRLGLDGWLDGSAVDSLRAQSIGAWRSQSAVLEEHWKKDPTKRGSSPNPLSSVEPFPSLKLELRQRCYKYDRDDLLLASLQDGYRHERAEKNEERSDSKIWESFFQKVVEDRAPWDAPQWTSLTDDERAAWLAHQLFRKNASPGRVHRFWRTSEAFFRSLLTTIRERASRYGNRWRVRRLVIEPQGGSWRDGETYHGVWRDAPFGVVFRAATQDFVTVTNLARVLSPMEGHKTLENQTIEVTGDGQKAKQSLIVSKVEDRVGCLGCYHPVIPLELNPQRFRIIVPLDAVDDVLHIVKERWENEFGRVWDRLPLYAGVVAFPRMTPFQAVIEAARNLEDELQREPKELWRVGDACTRDAVRAIRWLRRDGESELTATPIRLPDGREDLYYPHVAVENSHVRCVRDFQHPRGQVYRHVADVRPGDGAIVQPSRFATVFLDSTARRFDPIEVLNFSEIEQRAAVWTLIQEHAPSTRAVRDAVSVIEGAAESWLERASSADGRPMWLTFVRAVLHDKLNVRGAALDTLVDAARTGVLTRALHWKLQVLKEKLEPTDDL
jgi:CRISPR-associated Csx11 family protein